MQDREKIIERIKKLLEVTEKHGATEQEAVQAALMAQKLMAENDINDYELGDEAEPIEDIHIKCARRWQELLASVIAHNFRCKIFTQLSYENEYDRKRSTKVCFYGYRQDAKAASLVFEKLAKVGHKLGYAHAKTRLAELQREGKWYFEHKDLYNSFVVGFVDGAKSVLEKQSKELMIICPPKVNEAYEEFSKDFGKARKIRLNSWLDEESNEAGENAGRDAVNAGRVAASDNAYILA